MGNVTNLDSNFVTVIPDPHVADFWMRCWKDNNRLGIDTDLRMPVPETLLRFWNYDIGDVVTHDWLAAYG